MLHQKEGHEALINTSKRVNMSKTLEVPGNVVEVVGTCSKDWVPTSFPGTLFQSPGARERGREEESLWEQG